MEKLNELKNSIMENKKIETMVVFFIVLGISCIIFFPFLTMHYATDTYNVINVGLTNYALSNSFNDGRIVMGALLVIMDFLHIPISVIVPLFMFLSLIISSIIILILRNTLIKSKPSKNIFMFIISIVICYIIVFNFMYIECLYYLEGFVMALSILFYLMSAQTLVKKERKYIIKALILFTIGTFCYQGTVGAFLLFLLVLSMIKNKKEKGKIIEDILGGILILMIGTIINFAVIKINGIILNTEQTRVRGFLDCLKYIFQKLWISLYNTCGYFKPGMFLTFLMLICLTVIIFNRKGNIIINTLILIAWGIACGFSASLISSTGFFRWKN